MSRIVPRFELFDALECLGGVRLPSGGFVAPSSAVTIKSQEQAESCTVVTPRASDAGQVVREGHILRKWKSDTVIEEWPVGPFTLSKGDGATVTMVGQPVLYRLGWCGFVTPPGVDPTDGLPILSFPVSGTPTELVETFITARSPSDALATELAWLGIGTIDPMLIVSLNVDWWSPLQFLRGIIDALESGGVLADLSLPRNGATNYLIDILNTPDA